MNAYEYILSKQITWAKSRGIKLVGSEGDRGRAAYVTDVNDNLFEPLMDSVKEDINEGDGGELKGDHPKMYALHSSSALGVNIFQYWLKRKQVPAIAAACGLCNKGNNCSDTIVFEKKYPILNDFRQKPPNIDVVIENVPGSKFEAFAIECKFSEAYSPYGHSGIDSKYFKSEVSWEALPHLCTFAKSIEGKKDNVFKHLHPAQLVKHVLGLMKFFKGDKNKFCLLYLWYDGLGEEGAKHRSEINRFTEVAKKDKIHFHAMSYQELIVKLSKEYYSGNEKYVNYISSRYL